MKKFQILLAAAMALGLSACSSDNQEQVSVSQTRINLKSQINGTTRAADGIQHTSFDTGENIYVQISISDAAGTVEQDYAPINFTSAADGVLTPPANSYPYFPGDDRPILVRALYPYNWASQTTDVDQTFTVQSNQAERSDYKKSDLMYAKTPEPVYKTSITDLNPYVTLTFKHLLSKITVKLTSANQSLIASARVKLLNVRRNVSVNKETGELTVIDSESLNPKETVQLASSTSGLTTSSAIIIPQTVPQGKFIEIRLSNNDVMTYKLFDPMTFESGKSYTYNITVTESGLSGISTEVSDWGEPTDVSTTMSATE